MSIKLYYIGLDLHKKIIYYCIRLADGTIVRQGKFVATKEAILAWVRTIDQPFVVIMEATMFTAHVYDLLLPCAKQVIVANPKRLKGTALTKKKNDRLDAALLADLGRAGFIPECYMPPPDIRELRAVMRHRNDMLRHSVQLKNRTACLLMEGGVEYNKQKLHQKKYFSELLGSLEDIPKEVMAILSFNRKMIDTFDHYQKYLIRKLTENPLLKKRVERLRTIPGVGEVLALTWAVEIGDPHRFSSVKKVVSYCGLCSAERSSGGKTYRMPISKDRNKYLQWVLVEVAKIAPRYNGRLAEVHARELTRGNRNRATLAVARKLAAYLLSVDKSGKDFRER